MKIKLFRVCIPRTFSDQAQFADGINKMCKAIRRNARHFLKFDPNDVILVHENEIVGRFPSFSEGVNEGYGRFGRDQFLVQPAKEVLKPVTMPKTRHEFLAFFKDFFRGDILVTTHLQS
jgi:hypothetical protein